MFWNRSCLFRFGCRCVGARKPSFSLRASSKHKAQERKSENLRIIGQHTFVSCILTRFKTTDLAKQARVIRQLSPLGTILHLKRGKKWKILAPPLILIF